MATIGRYEVVRETGTRGLSVTYEAFDPVMRRRVSIEAPSLEALAAAEAEPGEPSEGARRTILRGQNLSNLNHPNIVKVLSCEQSGPAPFLVLEHVEGSTLSALLAENRVFTLAEATPLLRGIALGLDHAHSKGFVHRNITPANLLFGDGGEVKITGFEIAGASYFLEPELFETDPDLLLNSVHYMAPEFLLGETVDGRADQFSFAVVAFQMLTGSHPFEAPSPVALLGSIAFDGPLNLSLIESGFPPSVRKTIARALDPSPANRFASCTKFCDALEGLVERKPPSKVRVAPLPPPAEPAVVSTDHRRPAVAPAPVAKAFTPARLLLVGALIAIAIFGAVAFFKMKQTAPPAVVVPHAAAGAAAKETRDREITDLAKSVAAGSSAQPSKKKKRPKQEAQARHAKPARKPVDLEPVEPKVQP